MDRMEEFRKRMEIAERKRKEFQEKFDKRTRSRSNFNGVVNRVVEVGWFPSKYGGTNGRKRIDGIITKRELKEAGLKECPKANYCYM